MPTADLRIIFQDIDGCLNPVDGEAFSLQEHAPASANQAAMLQQINTAIEASPIEYFVLNTGRPMSMVQPLLEHLPTAKARFALLEHACVLYDRVKNNYIDCSQLAADCGLVELTERYQQVEVIHHLFDWYRQLGQSELEDHYKASLPALDKVGNLSFPVPEAVDGQILLEHFESLARRDLPAEALQQVQFLRSDRYIDILPGIDKLDGIHLLCAYLNIDLDHALAVGDFLNDLPVFEAFHRVLCPENAHPQIKQLTRSKGLRGHVSPHKYGLALLEFLNTLEVSGS